MQDRKKWISFFAGVAITAAVFICGDYIVSNRELAEIAIIACAIITLLAVSGCIYMAAGAWEDVNRERRHFDVIKSEVELDYMTNKQREAQQKIEQIKAELNDEAQKKAKQEAKAASALEIAKLKSALNRDRDEYNRKIGFLLQGKSWEDVERIGTRGGYLQGYYEAKMEYPPAYVPNEDEKKYYSDIDWDNP